MSENIIAKYLKKLHEQTKDTSSKQIYRGQSDKEWKLETSFKRRFTKTFGSDPNYENFIKYNKDLVEEAKERKYHTEKKLNDIELLAELQHCEASTGLIDFSTDFLIALWFASEDNSKNGKVFIVDTDDKRIKEFDKNEDKIFDNNTSNLDKKIPYIKNNFISNNRIFAQKGVFLFLHQTLTPKYETIIINKEDKLEIRKALDDIFDIKEETLFQDIFGFAKINNTEHRLHKKYKSSHTDYINQGNEYLYESAYKKAIDSYKKALEINPEKDEAHYNTGVAYGKLGENEKAIDSFKKALEINPENDRAYYNMGIDYDELGEDEKAIDSYEKALEINPNNDNAYYNMGVAYDKLGEDEKAIDSYEKALEINPKKDEAYNNMGVAYDELGEDEKAIDSYEKALEINPEKDEAYNNMGVAYGKLGEDEKAVDSYKKALDINPNNDDAYHNMGVAYGKLGEDEKAIDSFKKALDINPENDRAYYSMGIAYDKLGEDEKAIDSFKKALDINPENDDAYYNMGVAYFKLGEDEKAIDSYEKALEINPEKDEAYNNMGVAYGKLGEDEKAIDSYEKAVDINPKNDIAYINLFELQLIHNKPFDEKLENQFMNGFQDNKEIFMQYEMLEIFLKIKQNKHTDIKKWQEKYQNTTLQYYSFDELETWINNHKGKEKENLTKALNIFKSHNK